MTNTMKSSNRSALPAWWASLLLGLLAAMPAQGQEMRLASIEQTVDIKVAPDPGAAEVARAEPGDRFLILAEQDGWYQIQMFQDTYFLPRVTATERIEVQRLPDEGQRKAVFRDLYRAEEQAVKDAERQALIEEKTVVDDGVKNHFIERAKLKVARKYDLSVADCLAIAFEGADNGWSAN